MNPLGKIILFSLIILLTIYSPIELTRCIIKWGDFFHDFFLTLSFEVFFIWVFYLIALGLISRILWRKV